MPVQRSLHRLVLPTTLAMLAACAGGYGRHMRDQPDPSYASVSVQWDSGPLDRSYRSERDGMETRHSQETANPRSGESSDQRSQRQGNERQDLERRYASGKASHSHDLPPSER
jgi:hypothetical protein